ncbi:2-amino-4-hydroxy-6-hydroxymethyldihydropteridine diphosphokinase [Roseofilum casamattae]|uniref:2-amino-4-hydroxy-6-hydroxymethyldihydropteridine diphosphokinase n=1 Tax=Roseofilum casamattae BLCC-M143 TaxID=3022442 RepID=A0ABT7C322_9CYAN|nr:2-amino-4-hydroxy-6-hydroxymethyldihydropteridine diphosphokinase [Roseofilum casamattae]MDJ1185690.1 2-amino-4-hydroxy-6-hydroxymethyldihydropteridine diphosphokinase [Roseofilum casamattae BLCC-M143]
MMTSDDLETSKLTMSAIALGSNIGDSRAILDSALNVLNETPGITVCSYSSYYSTDPIGPAQPDILNACAILEVELTPQALLETLLDIEQQFGRVRHERWGPRSLDLDLLLFEDLILDMPNLQVPHPRMTERGFVLVPLAEIAPDWIEPVSGEAIATLLQKVDCSGVRSLNLQSKM